MNKKITIGIIITIVLLVAFLCGCTASDSYSEKVVNTELLGIWTGKMQYLPNINLSDFDFPKSSNHTNITDMEKFSSANITQLEFKKETVEMTIKTENETITMSNLYTVEGNHLSISIDFKGQRPGIMQPPEERERPSDWERPLDGDFPFGGERPSRTITYNYSYNADKTILYLDENPFYKLNS